MYSLSFIYLFIYLFIYFLKYVGGYSFAGSTEPGIFSLTVTLKRNFFPKQSCCKLSCGRDKSIEIFHCELNTL